MFHDRFQHQALTDRTVAAKRAPVPCDTPPPGISLDTFWALLDPVVPLGPPGPRAR